MLSSRERVIKAINHETPDRTPIDLGGTIVSGIAATMLYKLKQTMGLDTKVKVYELFQMLGEVEMDIIDALGVDVMSITSLGGFFDIKRNAYKPFKLFDGTAVLVPGGFNVETSPAGEWILHEGGDAARPIVAKMPKDGYYFDVLSEMQAQWDFTPPSLQEFSESMFKLTDEELEHLQKRARFLRQNTDKALILEVIGALGISQVGSITNFLMLLATDGNYVRELFDFETEEAIKNAKLLWQAVGADADIIVLDGFDYGTQKAEMINPEVFSELFLPHYKKQNEWIHKNTSWKTWKHSCGSIANIIPMLIESGLDIINPVQCSAANMAPVTLKEQFGREITFWGGGVDTQKTLPFGTVEEVRNEVAERIEIFGKNGGFVFSAIHNIQVRTPVENIIAAFETARDTVLV
jgi:uroporphyrinogen-III decarboxylase